MTSLVGSERGILIYQDKVVAPRTGAFALSVDFSRERYSSVRQQATFAPKVRPYDSRSFGGSSGVSELPRYRLRYTLS